MAKNSIEAYSADGKTNLLKFDPANLKLVTYQKHPLYDPRVEDPVREELVESIRYKGVAIPILVWKDPETGDTLVVDGRGRTKACREANKRLEKSGQPPRSSTDSVVKGGLQNAVAMMVMANEGRKDPTTSGRIKMAQKLVEHGYTEDQVAIVLHCSKSTVANYLAVGGATAAVRNAVESGKIALSDGFKLAKKEPDEQRSMLTKLIAEAPRAIGAKRSKNGAKAREIVSGQKAVKSKREITAKLAAVKVDGDRYDEGYGDALRWVLGLKETGS